MSYRRPLLNLDDYWLRAKNGPPFPKDDEMKFETIRWSSFGAWRGSCNTDILANAGFFYDGDGDSDTVKCYKCKNRFEDWMTADILFSRHRAFSPECTCMGSHHDSTNDLNLGHSSNVTQESGEVRLLNVEPPPGNHLPMPNVPTKIGMLCGYPLQETSSPLPVPMGPANCPKWEKDLEPLTSGSPKRISSSQVNSPPLKDSGDRVLEILGSLASSPEQNSGGAAANRVLRCNSSPEQRLSTQETDASSLRGISNGEAKTSSLQEGHSYSPALQCAGDLQQLQLEDPEVTLSRVHHMHRDCSGSSPKGCWSRQPEAVEGPSYMHTPAVLTAIEMGFHYEEVKKLVEDRLKDRGDEFVTADSLVDALLAMEAALKADRHGHASSSPNDVTESLQRASNVDQSAGEANKLDALRLENQKLRDQKLCKVCHQRDADVILRPCHHLVSCSRCMASLHTCPECQTPVRTKLQIFVA